MIDTLTRELRIELCPGNNRSEVTLRLLIEIHVGLQQL